ncbi:MAG: zinc-ribbon domain-containing protein [Holophagales bacterium]|jgi:hypothetical protein|nr:zinc-ribbon domain-containing protein [Holophagales bacterium]
MPIDTNCPNCSSDDTICVSMAIAEITAGARGRKVGKTEFTFIKKYAFNKQPTSGCMIATPIICGFVSLIIGIVSIALDRDFWFTIPSFIIGPSLIAFAYILMRGNSHLDQQKHEHAQWLKKLWICRKCGHEWTPE